MTLFELIALSLLAVLAGIVNTLAGGGSMLLLPPMIFMGIPAIAANASLRPGIVFQGLFGLLAFRRDGILTRRFAQSVLPLLLAAAPAAILAAYLVSHHVSDRGFELTLALVMAALAVLTLRRKNAASPQEKASMPMLVLVFLGVGFYGGFIQIGIGFLLATALYLANWSRMAEIHAAKVLIVFCYTLASLPIFILAEQIVWPAALALACGQSVGGFIGGRLASRVDDRRLAWTHGILMFVFATALLLRALLRG